jgi:hypothetical protein
VAAGGGLSPTHPNGRDRSRSGQRAPAADRSTAGFANGGQKVILDTGSSSEHTFGVLDSGFARLG